MVRFAQNPLDARIFPATRAFDRFERRASALEPAGRAGLAPSRVSGPPAALAPKTSEALLNQITAENRAKDRRPRRRLCWPYPSAVVATKQRRQTPVFNLPSVREAALQKSFDFDGLPTRAPRIRVRLFGDVSSWRGPSKGKSKSRSADPRRGQETTWVWRRCPCRHHADGKASLVSSAERLNLVARFSAVIWAKGLPRSYRTRQGASGKPEIAQAGGPTAHQSDRAQSSKARLAGS